MSGNRLLFIGEFPPPYGGVTIKDALLRDDYFAQCGAIVFDLYSFKRKPIMIPLLGWKLVKAVMKADRIALGIGCNSRLNILLDIIVKLKGRNYLSNVVIFMMGCGLVDYLRANPKALWKFSATRCIFTESKLLVSGFEAIGCMNSRYLPNFRRGDCAKPPLPVGEVVHFVYFAQVRREKGIDTLAEATRILNKEGLSNRFDVAIYGGIVDGYKEEFKTLIDSISNMEYRGVFNAASGDVYAELNQYDASVSSSWREGMSGSNIECKFAGIANIVSDAGFNPECIADGVDGLLVRPRDIESLVDAMRTVIVDHEYLQKLKDGSYTSRTLYDVKTWKREVLHVVGV